MEPIVLRIRKEEPTPLERMTYRNELGKLEGVLTFSGRNLNVRVLYSDCIALVSVFDVPDRASGFLLSELVMDSARNRGILFVKLHDDLQKRAAVFFDDLPQHKDTYLTLSRRELEATIRMPDMGFEKDQERALG